MITKIFWSKAFRDIPASAFSSTESQYDADGLTIWYWACNYTDNFGGYYD